MQRDMRSDPSFRDGAAPAGPVVLDVVTYNIHKGFSRFNKRMMIHEAREQLRELGSDIVFLQEVQGRHEKHARKFENWPDKPQHHFLAEDIWPSAVYGENVLYDHGHHGNAMLARFPIEHSHNQDVTHMRFERRGVLHCALSVPGLPGGEVHCVCVHLSIFARSRRRQMDALAGYLEEIVGPDRPLIVAGDFNDWRNQAAELLALRLGLEEVFAGTEDGLIYPGRSFPSKRPVFRLDRIYVRGFAVKEARILTGPAWSKISDHAALSARLEYVPHPCGEF